MTIRQIFVAALLAGLAVWLALLSIAAVAVLVAVGLVAIGAARLHAWWRRVRPGNGASSDSVGEAPDNHTHLYSRAMIQRRPLRRRTL